MAAISNFPNLRPSLVMDFANSGRADPRLSTVRGTIATRTSAGGKMEVVPAGAPRIEFDPATGRCQGLLNEEQRTNLLSFSNQFTDASWTKTRASVTPADNDWTLLTEDASSGSHILLKSITPAGNTIYVDSIELKAGTRKIACLSWANFANQVSGQNLYINLETGEYTGASDRVTVQKTREGYRVSLNTTTVPSPSGTISLAVYTCAAMGATTYQGDGVSGLYVRYSQAEVGLLPSSYIPTMDAAVTRSADAPVIQLLSPWFNEIEGTFLLDFYNLTSNATDVTMLVIDDGTTGQANQHTIRASASGTTIRYTPRAGGIGIADIGIINVPVGNRILVAVSYGPGICRASANGSAPIQVAAAALPTGLTRARFGQRGSGNPVMTGCFNSLRYYPKLLSSAQLQALSTP